MEKILCLLLSAILLCSCLPATHAAALSLEAAVEAAAAGSVVTLQADETADITIDKDLTLELNGFSLLGTVTVAENCCLRVKDSKTDDYTIEDQDGYGILAAVSGSVMAADGYMMLSLEEGISFHKVGLQLTTVTLRAESAGIYYTGSFFGDELVAANVDAYGIALRLDQAPDADHMRFSSAYSRYRHFAAGANGNTATGTLLKNVLRKGRPAAENKANSMTRRICAMPYILTTDGEYYFGDGDSRSFMKVMQEAERKWSTLTRAQKTALEKLYNQFESIMGDWYLPNLHPEDVDIPI